MVTYSTVIKGYCHESRLDKAFELKRAMQETRESNSDEITSNVLLDGCAQQGLYDRGIALLGIDGGARCPAKRLHTVGSGEA